MDIQSEYEYMPWCIYLIASRREVLFALLAKNRGEWWLAAKAPLTSSILQSDC